MLEDLIKGKGIIKCVNKDKEVYYLDIEAHKIYTPEELSKLFTERGEKLE